VGPPGLKLRRVNRRKKAPEIEEEADWVKENSKGRRMFVSEVLPNADCACLQLGRVGARG